ncbi:type II CAAX prenyl endopeptidase Rce1 family protein [Anaerolinea sp.]|uniref:CPBP family glutamic-type intramembrane protease n=1 Tax=Anaerolinea sp. TaxID=1872519 RepID=UPI002ACE41D9|nr:CPBP family glutamic-type intramembrane protease [Anaerolinea sp.]
MSSSSKSEARSIVQRFAVPFFILGTFLIALLFWLVPRFLGLQDAVAFRHWVALGSFAPALMALILQISDSQTRQRWIQGRGPENLVLSILAVGALYFICLPYASTTTFQVSLWGWTARVLLFIAGGAVLYSVLRRTTFPQRLQGWLVWLSAALTYPLLMLLAWAIWTRFGATAQINLPEGGTGRLALSLLASYVYFFLFGGVLGGEPGWRGWLFPRLLNRMPFWTAVLAVGVLEALWVVPLYFNGYYLTGNLLWQELAVRGLLTLVYAVWLGWVWVRLQGNLFPVMLLRTGMAVTPLFIAITPLSWGFLAVIALILLLNLRRFEMHSG